MKPRANRPLARAAIILAVAMTIMLPSPGSAYFIKHTNNALDPAASPEIFRPALDGSRPGPNKAAAPLKVEILPLPSGWPAGIEQAVERGVMNWAQVPGLGIPVSVEGPAPGAAYDNNWASRYGVEDGRNTIEFITSGWPSFLGPTVIAITVPYLDADGSIVESDIFCNAQDLNWAVFGQEGFFPALAGQKWVDVEAIITHEMGHMFGLEHSQYEWASMYFLPGLADTRARRLTTDDRQGVRALYPAGVANVPPPSLWGIHEAVYGGDCGQAALTFNSARIAYVDRTSPLEGPHELLIDPPLAGESVWPFCLLGSGFQDASLLGVDLAVGASVMDAVTTVEFIGPNFIRAILMNDAGGFPPLAPGAYDVMVDQDPGGPGPLPQGVFVKPLADAMPEAVIQPAFEQAPPGVWIGLDGSGSFDPDGDPITYSWSIEEAPFAGAGTLSSNTTQSPSLLMSAPGLYVIRLVINDGVMDGIADQVLIRAVITYAGSDDDSGGFNLFGCAILENKHPADAPVSIIILLLVPAALALLARKLLIRA